MMIGGLDDMDEERDLVVFEDDAGNQMTMEVLDYLAYEGKEYALLTEYVQDDDDGNEDEPVEVSIMEVVPVGEDQEEFVPIDDALAEKLLKIFESQDFDDEELEDE
jgi:tryptophanyl-tRNA synthetase